MKSSFGNEFIRELNIAPVSHKKTFSRRSNLPLDKNVIWKIEEGDIVGRELSKTEAFEIECFTRVEATLIGLHDLQSINEVLLDHIQQSEELTIIRSYRTVDLIVVKLLGWLAKKFGYAVENGHLIDLRLTHQDIAEIVGSTRVTVTRILAQLEQQGIIQRLPMHTTLVQVQELWHYEI
jgi:Crp-like helix-turn-helix domain